MGSWTEPKLLFECINDNLKIRTDTARLIEDIDKPIVIVTIAGPCRTGKSYLMNRLAGKNAGFSLGSTIESHTKGIWAWLVKHPLDDDKALLLMDTEGLGDPLKGDERYDTWICCLSILLSSVFIYNIMGTIGSSVINQLSFILEMSQHLQAKSKNNSDVQLDEVFPMFILAIRDFYLKLETDKKITSDEYLEETLTMKKTTTTGKKENEIRKKIRSYFKHRKCFCFQRPTNKDEDLLRLDTITEDKLKTTFLQQSEDFCNCIFENAPVKRVDYSQVINGKIFMQLADIYMDAICNGAIPCIETTITLIKARENEKVLHESVKLYEENFQCVAAFPISTEELTDIHKACYRSSVQYFGQKVFLDEGTKYHECLQDLLNEKYLKFTQENITASTNKCNEQLQVLLAMIDYNVETGSYIEEGGYETYMKDMQDVELRYFATSESLGPLAEKVWLDKMKQLELQRQTVLKYDQSLKDSERNIKMEEAKRLEIVKQLDQEKWKLKELQLHEQTLSEAHEEHVEDLRNLYVQKMHEQEAEFNKIKAKREDEQKRLMAEKFEQEAQDLKAQLSELEKEQKSLTMRIFDSVVGIGGNVLLLIPHPVARGVGIGLNVLAAIMNFFR